MKIVIIGNSGSGKTWLAKKLCSIYPSSIIHFDEIFWEPGGFNKKRAKNEIIRLIKKSRQASSWIAEGVFGKIAEFYLEEANMIIWLDLPIDICLERLRNRGSESKKHMNREQSEKGLEELSLWASQYKDRDNMSSFSGHKQLFKGFRKEKFRFCSEIEVSEFIQNPRERYNKMFNLR